MRAPRGNEVRARGLVSLGAKRSEQSGAKQHVGRSIPFRDPKGKEVRARGLVSLGAKRSEQSGAKQLEHVGWSIPFGAPRGKEVRAKRGKTSVGANR